MSKSHPRKIGAPYVPAQPPKPWERQAGETDAGWGTFQVYRDLGPGRRSLAEAGRLRGVTKVSLEPMSRRWHFVERVQAYDAHCDHLRLAAQASEIADMQKRHIAMAMSVQGSAALALNKLIAAERAKPDSVLKPGEIATLIDLGTKLERLNRGEPESIQENRIAAGTGAPGIESFVIKFVRPGEKETKPKKAVGS